jgi:hypothetical protein
VAEISAKIVAGVTNIGARRVLFAPEFLHGLETRAVVDVDVALAG